MVVELTVLLVHIPSMRLVTLKISPTTETMLSDIADALEKTDGYRPTRSHVFRLAVATMRKRLSDEGLIREQSA